MPQLAVVPVQRHERRRVHDERVVRNRLPGPLPVVHLVRDLHKPLWLWMVSEYVAL